MDIVIFALIAGFVAFKLHSVLGRRHGEERQRPPLAGGEPAPGARPPGDNVVVFTGRNRNPVPQPETPDPEADLPASLEASLKRIRNADPNFDEKTFLAGARAAFQMIIAAFAAGDTATLEPLLSEAVFADLSAAIQRRRAAGETLEKAVERIREADITGARLNGRTAFLTVTFISDQREVTRSATGAVLDGRPGELEEVEDVWTFSRDTQSPNPNWRLVDTGAPAAT